MNKIVILFMTLFIVFCGAWVFKSKTPLNKQTDTAQNIGNWWGTDDEVETLTNEVDSEWILDAEIEANYIPVMGEDELYMVVDDNGKIIKYRHRYKDSDGAWVWEDVNPDIPANYEPVEGLEDVYKVTDENGNIKYYKYIRNDDNTYAFIEVDKDGNIIDDYIVKCETEAAATNSIPVNYTQLSGNVYAVKDENNVTVGYKKKNEDADGNITWTPTSKPSTDTSSHGSNVVTNKVVTNKGSTNSVAITTSPPSTANVQTGTITQQSPSSTNSATVTTAPVQTAPEHSTTTSNSKTYTQSESYREEKIVGNYKYIYEYTVIKTYDENNELISTKTEGPELVDKQLITGGDTPTVDQNLIESNIDNEIVRVTNGLQESTDIESGVINSLNAARADNGVASLNSGGDAQKLAVLFAADMATYASTSSTSSMYGTIDELMSRYSISNNGYGLNVWRTLDNSSDKIHQRFQSIENCRSARMNSEFNCVGVGVFQKDGYYYVAEVLLEQ